jgi:hypothetical protein
MSSIVEVETQPIKKSSKKSAAQKTSLQDELTKANEHWNVLGKSYRDATEAADKAKAELETARDKHSAAVQLQHTKLLDLHLAKERFYANIRVTGPDDS